MHDTDKDLAAAMALWRLMTAAGVSVEVTAHAVGDSVTYSAEYLLRYSGIVHRSAMPTLWALMQDVAQSDTVAPVMQRRYGK